MVSMSSRLKKLQVPKEHHHEPPRPAMRRDSSPGSVPEGKPEQYSNTLPITSCSPQAFAAKDFTGAV